MNVKISYKDGEFWAFDCHEILWDKKEKELVKVEEDSAEAVDLGSFEDVDLILVDNAVVYNRVNED